MFPLVLKMHNKKILFVGGGEVAERKINSLLSVSNPPFIKVVAPQITTGLKKLCNENKINWNNENFSRKREFVNFDYIFICTDNKVINEEAADFFAGFYKEINVCDNKEKSTFFMPAVTKNEKITIAVSTSGNDPAYAKKIKNLIEKKLNR